MVKSKSNASNGKTAEAIVVRSEKDANKAGVSGVKIVEKSSVIAKSLKKKTVSSLRAAAEGLGEDTKIKRKSPQKIQQKSFKDNNLMLLPIEMKLEVFKYLSPQDLMAVSATCHELHCLIQDPSLWTELTVDISESRRSLIMKMEKCPWLHTLKLTNKKRADIDLNKFRNMVRRAPRLKSLIWVDWEWWLWLVKWFNCTHHK